MLKTKAFAKINLGLGILDQRNDGYHNIETIFHRVNIYDEITLEHDNSIKLYCNNPAIPLDINNLCYKAVKLLQEKYNVQEGVRINLTKNIPVGSGLGGGSSDAASTLLGLMKLWNLKINYEELFKMALTLGSDVPYFLKPGTAYAKGRGEVLDYFQLDIPYWIVVIYPNINISTQWAYQAINSTNHKRHKLNKEESTSFLNFKQVLLSNIQHPEKLSSSLYNDFEPIILHSYESIAYVKVVLYAAGAKFAQMSGSGSAIYGFFESEELVKSVIEKYGKQYQIYVTPPYFQPTEGII